MRIAMLLAVGFLALPAQAQTPLNFGDASAPKPDQPVPLNTKDWQRILTPQVCPSGVPAALNTCGDGKDGYGWSYSPYSKKMELRPPKILAGPGAITSNISLVQNAWTNMFTGVGASGFRGGLTGYIMPGNYNGNGQIAVASGTVANATYTVRVLMGSAKQSSGAQQGILIIPQVATNAATASGSAVLNFASTAGIQAGMVAYNTTSPRTTSIGPQILVSSVTSTTVTLSGNVSGAGVSSGDVIMFGFVIGYGGPTTWPGGSSLPFTIPYVFTTFAGTGCYAAINTLEQCEVFTQVYTTDSGATVLSAGGQVSNPPYSTSFNIWRMDGGYGAN